MEGSVLKERSRRVVADRLKIGGNVFSSPVRGRLIVGWIGLKEADVVGAGAEEESIGVFEADRMSPATQAFPLSLGVGVCAFNAVAEREPCADCVKVYEAWPGEKKVPCCLVHKVHFTAPD